MHLHFLVELTNTIDNFRIQNDGSYRKISSPVVKKNDKLFYSINEIINLQKIDEHVVIDGKTYLINSSHGINFGDTSQLGYELVVKRDIFPLTPSKDQMRSVIAQGDDRFDNSLILNVYGFFEIRYFDTIDFTIEDPTIVVRNETYGCGNEYVGSNAVSDNSHIDNTYVSMLDLWLDHLKFGKLHHYTDTFLSKTESEVFIELEALKINFGK